MNLLFRSTVMTSLLGLASAVHADIGPIPGPGLPGFAGCASLKITNTVDKWIWITVYDLTRTRHLDYGWITPGTMREWQAGSYSCAGVYYLRAQVKGTTMSSPGPDGPDIFDTTVQITGKSHEWYLYSNQYKDPIGNFNYDADTSFFWSSTPNLARNAEKAVALPRLDITNASERYLNVGQGFQQYASPPGPNISKCVQPHTQYLMPLTGIGTQSLNVAEDSRCNMSGGASTATFGLSLGSTTPAFYGMGLAADKPVQNVPGSAVTFSNPTATPVQFMIDGQAPDKSPCVAPGATSAPVTLLGLGKVKVTPTTRTKCGDTAGTALNAQSIGFAPAFRINYVLKQGLYLR